MNVNGGHQGGHFHVLCGDYSKMHMTTDKRGEIIGYVTEVARESRWPNGPGSSPGRGTALCSWERHFILIVPLSTQVYKWVPANLLLGVTLRWTSISSRGE